MSLDGYEQGAVVGGRYVIERVVGEGGAAVVFRARELSTGRAVALKVVRETGEAARANLSRERDALARVCHPRVVRLLGDGSLPDGRAYLVTTFVAGATLRTLLDAGPLAPRDALRTCAAVASAVSAMHAAGMLHRDLKPANVIIPERAGRADFGRATLIDLGVFGELGHRTVAGAAQTRWGRVSGTPWYMAPE
jgi:serine/threonine protein kinase